MGMSREEFAIAVKGLKAVYTDPKFLPDKDAFNVWYELLKDLEYTDVSRAIQKHIMSEKWPPTIADIRAQAARKSEGMNEMQACALIRRAVCNSTYHSEDEFYKLPTELQQAVGTPENLREWAKMESDSFESVVLSQFLRSYRVVQKRNADNAVLPERLQTLIETTARRTLPEPVPLIGVDAVEPPKDLLRLVAG